MKKEMRKFETGATRNLDDGKFDYDGFLSPLALKRFAEYMHKHRKQKDGTLRNSDNWQRGIPKEEYIKSLWRHFMEVWENHRKGDSSKKIEDALCAMYFNVQGYLHELLKENLK